MVIIYAAVFLAVLKYFQVAIVYTKPIQSKESAADLLLEQSKDLHGDNKISELDKHKEKIS